MWLMTCDIIDTLTVTPDFSIIYDNYRASTQAIAAINMVIPHAFIFCNGNAATQRNVNQQRSTSLPI